MKNVLKNYQAFINGRKENVAALEAKLEKIRATYKDETDPFVVQMGTDAQANFTRKAALLEEQYLGAITAEFEQTRQRIRAVLTKPVPPDMLNTIKSAQELDQLTGEEREALYQLTANNYMAHRLVDQMTLSRPAASKPSSDALAEAIWDVRDLPKSPESLLARLDELESMVREATRNQTYGSLTAMLEDGQLMNALAADVEKFISTYA